MVGFVEAVDFLGLAPEQIRLLSLSTTSYPFRIGQKQQFGGLLGWSTKIIEALMFGQAQAAGFFPPLSQSLSRASQPQTPAGRRHTNPLTPWRRTRETDPEIILRVILSKPDDPLPP